ncbi:hypothetical protein Tco_0755614 [Tanacetum coccineum]
MTKVIKGEFKKIKDVKVEDVSLTYDKQLENFNLEVSQLCGIADDLFTYDIEVANILCDLIMDDGSKDEADDDMGYDPPDVAFIEWLRGDYEVELTDEESSDDEEEIAEVFRIDTNIFDCETPICSAFNEFNYLLKIDPDLLTKDIIGFKTYDDYKNDWIYEFGKKMGTIIKETYFIENQLHYQDLEWYVALEDSELKDEALRNKAIMEGFMDEDDDKSCYEQKKRWDMYTNYDDTYETNHEEYVAIKEDEYDDLERLSNDACRAYQEIFRPREGNIDEYWWRIYESGNLEVLES